MATRSEASRPALITSARHGSSLSTDQRERRYLVTMLFRVVSFLAAAVTPLPWNVLLFLAAALLPAVAVLLGNARDNRIPAVAEDDDEPEQTLRALTAGAIIEGDVEPDKPVEVT